MRNAPQTAFNRENWMIDLNHTLSNTKSRSYPKAFPLTTANLGVSDHALNVNFYIVLSLFDFTGFERKTTGHHSSQSFYQKTCGFSVCSFAFNSSITRPPNGPSKDLNL